MRRVTKAALVSGMTELLASKAESVRLEAARIILATEGTLLTVAESAAAQQAIADRLRKKKELKRIQNRRAYIRLKIRKLKAKENDDTK